MPLINVKWLYLMIMVGTESLGLSHSILWSEPARYSPGPNVISDDEKRKAWDSMNKALNRDKKDYTELVEFAKESRHANKLGETIDQETAQRQVDFVGSLIVAFIKYLSEPEHPSELDNKRNPTTT
jgi:hypothetical protein